MRVKEEQQMVWCSRWSLQHSVMLLANEESALWITEELESINLSARSESSSCRNVFLSLSLSPPPPTPSVQPDVLIGSSKIFLTHSKQPPRHQSARRFTGSLQEVSHQTAGIVFFFFFLFPHTGHKPASLSRPEQPSQLKQDWLLG